MAIDPYAPCPCGSGKKLKFCCNDLAADIEKVQSMVAGEQPHAALKHVAHLLEKHPKRVSLLDLKASLELSLHEFEAARETIDAFLATDPQNATAHAQQAILRAATDDGRQAVESLQVALEQLDDDMPLRVLEAIGAVGQALLLEGELVAARGHLLLYAAIAPEGDNRALELLLRMNLQAGMPLIMREYLVPADCPNNVPWQEQFNEASRCSARGMWRRAAEKLEKLLAVAGRVPAIVYNLALVQGWLGDTAQLAARLHEYAQLDVPIDAAVEAEALAQLVDPSLTDPQLETVKLSFSVDDVEQLAERLVADKHVEDYALDLGNDEEEEVIRPRSTHILLDRPTPTTGVDIKRDEVPSVVAFMCLYGRRTDREARLEVTTDRDDTFDQVQSLLEEIAGDTVGELADQEVVANKSISEESLSWRWRLPDDTPAEHRRQLLADQRREAILDQWTVAPRAALNDKSPREAVGDSALSIALAASALIIEQAAVDSSELPIFCELRRQLSLPEPSEVDPTDLDLDHLPLVRVPRLQLAKIADEPLAKLLDRSVLMGADLATLLVAAELANRPELADGVDRATAFRQLIRLESNHQLALEWLGKARAWSRAKDDSTAKWALMELEISIERGEAASVQRVLGEIRTSHLNEPGVADATYRVLHAAGLIAPDGPAAGGSPMPAVEEAAQPNADGGIWTPGDPEPAAEGRKSALWTP